MKQHGKKSAAAIAAMMVVDGGFGAAVEPPEGMPEHQAQIWRETVKGEPPEFFRRAATKDMLADYCNQRAVADEMSNLINEFNPEWLAEAKGMRRYEWLTKMRRMASRAAMDLARQLRLTNQSRWQPSTAGTAGATAQEEDTSDGSSPWMTAGRRSA